ncbi:site-specific integrase [Vibrio metschnikovii]|nr:site-specific integrase [Vibrio metschnikovii]EKO3616205.1 site-specific integrase [Vibrio metschnikovii]EKO3639359.1 site-specific integrase [Vibrio metschnikovii]EKO3643627.1 site-specific integrase [Vibrio metschnikovii]EKO3668945.1 site-specific integrase [Vibrio metschnikovii]
MATLVKTSSGTWKAVIRKTGWPTTSKTFRLKRDAEDWARRTEDEIVRGVYIKRSSSERLTIEEALKRYLAEISPTKRPATAACDARHSKPIIKALGKYSLAALTPEIIAKYRDDRLAGLDRCDARGNPAPKPRSPNTVRIDLSLLSHLYNIAIKEWGIGLAINPVQNIRKPSPPSGRERRLTEEEELQLLEAVEAHTNPMLAWIVRIALETGMRSSEITSLRRSQVDLKKRVVFLVETKNTMPRTVPLSLLALKSFKQAINNPVRPIDTDLIFFGEPSKDGKRRPYNFNKVWMKIKAKIGLKDFKFHDLRHESVSRLVEGGLSDQQVAAISGHKSMQMLRRYTHLRAEDLVEELDAIAKGKKA